MTKTTKIIIVTGTAIVIVAVIYFGLVQQTTAVAVGATTPPPPSPAKSGAAQPAAGLNAPLMSPTQAGKDFDSYIAQATAYANGKGGLLKTGLLAAINAIKGQRSSIISQAATTGQSVLSLLPNLQSIL